MQNGDRLGAAGIGPLHELLANCQYRPGVFVHNRAQIRACIIAVKREHEGEEENRGNAKRIKSKSTNNVYPQKVEDFE